MTTPMERAEEVRRQIAETEKKLEELRTQLRGLESPPNQKHVDSGSVPIRPEVSAPDPEWKWPLQDDEYARYGRQLILPTIGIKGQLRLKASAVLIIGAGGLGCPAAAYLAGAGVRTLGIVDGDVVELSNLHRQIAHSTSRIGTRKVDSLVEYCRGLNPEVQYRYHSEHLTPQNAEDIVAGYDVVLDCTDHPTSRYLISDICVLLRKPLVSASALRTDGQLIVLNNPPAPQGSSTGDGGGGGGGPCYRCVFPKPPPAESVVSCGEGGILGPVVGVMGVLQALEAIKLITTSGPPIVNGGREQQERPSAPPSLLLFSAMSSTPFRSIRMRSRRPQCLACSAESTLTLKELRSGSLDYVQFCGVNTPIDILRPEERISATEYSAILKRESIGFTMDEDTERNKSSSSVLLDVREKEHFEIGSIPGAINVPFSVFQARRGTKAVMKSGGERDAEGERGEEQPGWIPPDLPRDAAIFVVCRVGNDSQLVARQLKEIGLDRKGERYIGDIKGGMKAWKQEIDPTMPFT